MKFSEQMLSIKHMHELGKININYILPLDILNSHFALLFLFIYKYLRTQLMLIHKYEKFQKLYFPLTHPL